MAGRVAGAGAAARLLARARLELALLHYGRERRLESLQEQRNWRARWHTRLTGSTVAALAALALCVLAVLASRGPARDHNAVLAETVALTQQSERHARTALNDARADERAVETELLGALRASMSEPDLDEAGEPRRPVVPRSRWVAPAPTPSVPDAVPAPKPPACAGNPYDPLNFCL